MMVANLDTWDPTVSLILESTSRRCSPAKASDAEDIKSEMAISNCRNGSKPGERTLTFLDDRDQSLFGHYL